ncbi:MAG: DMT family transporter [Actinomycetota bacterium]|nr:DMT family transporter [Actinomycetota bacterium]
MSAAALALVLPSAVAHATWNMLAKRSNGGLPYVWLAGAMSSLLMVPVVIGVALAGEAHMKPEAVPWMVASGAIHIGYYTMLQRGYGSGDLSVVYPLARGTGPLLATVGAVVILSESPSALTLLGAGAILSAIMLIGLSALRRSAHQRRAALYALATGAFIATYTLWDKHGVDGLGTSPVVYLFGGEVVRTAVMLPLALRRREETLFEWREHRTEVMGNAVLAPISYGLFLSALALAPVSAVAPLRECGILLGVVLGGQLLSEPDTGRRALAAAAMIVGIAALASG